MRQMITVLALNDNIRSTVAISLLLSLNQLYLSDNLMDVLALSSTNVLHVCHNLAVLCSLVSFAAMLKCKTKSAYRTNTLMASYVL